MHKISRIRLVRVGHPQAWFEDVVIDTTDPRTGDPCDTILFGANGDGKSTLIALVFSCFEPKTSLFLKHLSKSSQEFHEYFGPEVGFILVEWVRQDSGSLFPRRLITGQAVAFRQDRPGKTERLFFAFDAGDDANLDSEDFGELRSLDALRRWVHRMEEAHRNDLAFYATSVQDQWRDRLMQRIVGLDQVLLAQQVQFSISEGGMDDTFLNFKSEEQFIGRFFDLTINRQHAETVRDELVAYAVKHQDRPDKLDRLDALTAFSPVVAQFAENAASVASRREARILAERQSATLAEALRTQAMVLDAQAEEARGQADALEGRKSQALQAAQLCEADAESFDEENLRRQATRAFEASAEAEAKATEAKTLRNSVAIAQIDVKLAAEEAAIGELDTAIEAGSREIEPYRREVETKAARLRSALGREIAKATDNEDRLLARSRAAKRRVSRAPIWTERAAKRAKDAATAKDRAEGFFQRYDGKRAHLVSAGTLLPDEGVAGAAARWAKDAMAHREQAALAEARLEEVEGELARVDDERLRLKGAEAKLQERMDGLNAFLESAEAARMALVRNPILRRFLEGEDGDPDDDGQFQQISGRVADLENEERLLLRRIELLDEARRTITDTGLAFKDKDVRLVVDTLTDMGIGSAKAYAEYVSNTVLDAVRARELVKSDPARFLGVHVQTAGDLERVRSLHDRLNSLPLGRPVVVSLPDITPAAPTDKIVLGPQDDSAFNKVAAQTVLDGLETDRRAADGDLQRVSDELSGLRALLYDRDFYLHTHGPGLRADKQEERGHCATELARVAKEGEDCDRKRGDLLKRQSEARSTKETAEKAARCAEEHENACRAFVDEYESKRAAQLKELSAATAAEAVAESWREKWSKWGLSQTEKRAEFARQADEAGKRRQALDDEQAALGAGPVEDHGSETLDVVRRIHLVAKEALDQREKDKVELLVVRRGEMRKRVDDLRRQRSQAESPWDEELVAHLIKLTEAELEGRLAEERKIADDSASAARRASIAHAAVEGKADQYAKGRKHPDHRAVGIDEVADARLDAEARDSRERAQGHREQATRHDRDKQAAEKRAGAAQAEAEFVRDKAKEITRTLPDVTAPEAGPPPVLPEGKPAIGGLVDSVLQQANEAVAAEREAEKAARAAWDEVRKALDQLKNLTKERRLAEFVGNSSFEVAMGEAPSTCLQIEERIGVIKADLEQYEESTRILVRSLDNLLLSAVRILRRATQAKIPDGVPQFGGLSVLKTSFDADRLPTGSARDDAIERYLKDLIASNLIPENGAKVAAGLLRHMAGGESTPFRIRILKPKEGQADSYMPIDRVTTSGGEGLTTAILLYCVLAQLRAEETDNRKGASGGVLILDNPFAKANKTVFIQAQRQMAAAMGLQLIYATGLKDYNALGQFQRFWRLRPAKRGKATGRTQVVIEPADMLIEEQIDGPERAIS